MSFGGMIEVLMFGTISSIWPLLVVPAVVGLVSDRTARHLPMHRADWRIAGLLSAFPGLVMLSLCIFTIGLSFFHLHADDLRHFFKFQVGALIALCILGRGAIRAYGRIREVRVLVARAVRPNYRLARVADSIGVEVSELPIRSCECFVAGFWSPRVYVSSGAIAKLSDSELAAALCHERAHMRSHDSTMFTILDFLQSIAWSSKGALEAYSHGRERCADRAAVREAGQVPVASALVALARRDRPPAYAVGMGTCCAPLQRLKAILEDDQPHVIALPSRLLICSAIATNAALIAWPVFQNVALPAILCTCGS